MSIMANHQLEKQENMMEKTKFIFTRENITKYFTAISASVTDLKISKFLADL